MASVTIQNLGGGTLPPATFAANSDFVGITLSYYNPPPPPFEYRVEGGLATITRCSLRPNILAIPPAIDGWPVGRIASMVFAGRPELVGVLFPGTLVEIGQGAFSGCRALREVHLPQGLVTLENSAFELCSSLETVKLGSNLTRIPKRAFAQCEALTEIVLPESIRLIDDGAFRGCSLSWATVPGTVSQIGDQAFEGCPLVEIRLSEGTRTIGSRAFANCTRLPVLALPRSLTRLGAGAISGCTELVQISVPGGVADLPSELFRGCTGLVQVRLESGVRSIGEFAFAECSALQTVEIPATLEGIRNGAFVGCTRLQSLYFTGLAPETSGPTGLQPDAVVYHLPGQPGWLQTWNGISTRAWLPALTVRAEGTAMRLPVLTVGWAEGQTVVLEGSENLEAPVWFGISTNRLEGRSLAWTLAPAAAAAARFFRVSVP